MRNRRYNETQYRHLYNRDRSFPARLFASERSNYARSRRVSRTGQSRRFIQDHRQNDMGRRISSHINNKLNNAATPNAVTITPDTRFTHRNAVVLNRLRNKFVPPLSSSHHAAEPKNTPTTMATAVNLPRSASANPKPAKIAAKDRIVSGLVRVSIKVDP